MRPRLRHKLARDAERRKLRALKRVKQQGASRSVRREKTAGGEQRTVLTEDPRVERVAPRARTRSSVIDARNCLRLSYRIIDTSNGVQFTRPVRRLNRSTRSIEFTLPCLTTFVPRHCARSHARATLIDHVLDDAFKFNFPDLAFAKISDTAAYPWRYVQGDLSLSAFAEQS